MNFFRCRFFRFSAGLAIGLLIAALAAFNFLLLWVATGPRSLDVVTPYIEAALETEDHGYKVSIGHTWLIWDGWKHPIDIRLRNVRVLTKGGQLFSRFPEISLGVYVPAVLAGKILPTSLTLTRPAISLFQNEDKSISLGFQKEPDAETEETQETQASAVPFAAVMAPLLSPEGTLRKLRAINILDADISVGSAVKGVFFKASNADIILKRDRQGILQAHASATIAYGDYRSGLTANLSMRGDSPLIEGEFTVEDLVPGKLAALFSKDSPLSSLRFPVSGGGTLAADRSGRLRFLNFNITGGQGAIVSDKLAGELPVTSLQAIGRIGENASQWQIDRLEADLDGIALALDGTVDVKEGDVAVRANASVKNVPTEKVPLLWPPSLAPLSREWMVSNITDGQVKLAQVYINIGFGDLAKPALPKEAVDAVIELESAKVRYLPEHPQIHNVKARIGVNGLSLDAEVTAAEYLKATKISKGRVLIEDLNDDNPYIKVEFDADTTAKDVVHFLGLPRLKHAAKLNLSEESVAGEARGHAATGFRFFAPRDEQGNATGEGDIDYAVTAEVKGLTQPGFMEKFDIADADGTFSIDNRALEFEGKGNVNGASAASAKVKYVFEPQDGLDTFIEVEAAAPVASLPRFGYPAFPYLSGTLRVAASMKLGEGREFSEATIDLTQAQIGRNILGWLKPIKEPATLRLTSEKKDGIVRIPSFAIEGPRAQAKGKAEMSPDMALQKVDLERLRFGSTDLTRLAYEEIEGGFSLEASGASANLEPWLDMSTEENSFSFAKFPALALNVDLAKVALGEGRVFSGVKGTLACDRKRCESAKIAGATLDGKPFSFRILRNPKGKRQLSLRAQSAGAFLKAIHLIDGMEGGDLSITGSFSDGAPGAFKGRVDLSEHVLKQAPILARILSLASLTGFFDTLQGNGIRFKRMLIPFTLENDVITIEKAKTFGDSLGMTADGTITFPQRRLALEGTIVPSYSLNTAVGKVPIVGPVLAGGEGQGLFAASYSVKGSEKEPEVTVNPLSILTPGFLRGLFDILDGPDKAPAE